MYINVLIVMELIMLSQKINLVKYEKYINVPLFNCGQKVLYCN